MNTYEDIKALITRLDSIANAPVSEDAEKTEGLLMYFQKKHDEYKKEIIQVEREQGKSDEQIAQVLENNDELVELESIVDALKKGDMNAGIEEINKSKFEFSGVPGDGDDFMQVIDKLGIPKDTFWFTKNESVSEQPTDEAKSGITDANYKLLMMDISSMKDRIAELNIDDDSKTRALTALGDVEDELNFDESYQPFPEGDEFNIEEDEDFEEVLGPLGFPEDETELFDAEYQGRKVPLNKPMRGDVKKFKVYVKDPKSGNVKKVNFGHGGTSAKRKTMRIRKSNPKARKSFRARHNCANPGPKTKARYWSCRKW